MPPQETIMPGAPLVWLNDGHRIPKLGLGLWLVGDDTAAEIVVEAIAAGYRSFDTAYLYRNEKGVGQGIARSPVKREELFIATKLWNTRHGFNETLKAFDESMERLGLAYLDLYMIHWPVAGSEKYIDSWKAFIRLREEGRVRSIGVSNFLESHLDRLIEETGVAPAVNQIEYHPYFQQPDLARANARRDIVTQCWAPLGRGEAMKDPVIAGIAAAHGKSPAQIIIRWHLDNGNIVIPKSSNPARMRENLDVFDFHLKPAELAAIESLHTGKRTGPDPAVHRGLDVE